MGLDEMHTEINTRGFGRRSTARSAGVSDAAFSRHAKQIGLESWRRDIWVPAGAQLTHEQQIDATMEVLDDDVLITAASGLYLDGILTTAPAEVELLLAAGRHLRQWPSTCFHRSTTFGDVRAHYTGGRRIAAVPRCFADHSAHVSVNELCRDIATALRPRRCTLGTIAMELQARRRFPGRGRLRLPLGRLEEEVTHSSDERLARRVLRADGLRFHHEPMVVEGSSGPIAEIDIAFPDLMLGIEIDGPQHLLPDVAAADRQRDRALARLGWRIERFFWFEVEERQAWFVAEVKRAVAEQAATIG